MDTSIPALSNGCFNALKRICSRIERETTSDTGLAQISRWQDELGRLRLWAANIGAHQTGQSSLEFRLKDSSHIRQQVANLLLDLGQMFQEVEEVLDSLSNGQDSHKETDDASDDDYDTGEELTQLHSNIVTVINCLFQMSMLVRKPARHDFHTLPQSKEVLAFKPFDQAHVKEKYPEADERLLARLGFAITLRRQYLRYRERHHAKLKQGLVIGTEGSVAPTVMLSDTVVTGVEPWRIDSQDETTVSEISHTSYASSMVAGGPLVIPAPPKESSGGAPFECPYCFVVISVDGTSAWHKHVFQDLQPYICTVADCSTPHTLFTTRHEWVQHMRESHPRNWTGDKNGATAAINGLNQSSFRATCPLCKANSRSENHFVRHLARHLQELALFVLPQDDADSNDSDPLEEINSEGPCSSTMSPIPDHINWHDEQQVQDRQSDRDLNEAFDASTGGPLERGWSERQVQPERMRSDSLKLELPANPEYQIEFPGQLRDSRPDPPYGRRTLPSHNTSRASIRPRLNEFFLDGTGIHREVMQAKLHDYLGPEAYSKPHTSNGIQGYLVSAIRTFTSHQLDDLQELSTLYESELHERSRRGILGIPYEQSETYRRQDANLNYPEETDMINNRFYSPLPTPSGSTRAPGGTQPLPPGLSGLFLDVGSPNVRPPIRRYPSARPSIPEDPYRASAGYGYANSYYPEETDMINNHFYSSIPTPSGSTGAPGGIQPLPSGLSGSSRANLDAGFPYARPSIREDAYTTDARYPSARPSIPEDPYRASARDGYAGPSGREDPRMPPRGEDPYRASAGYGYARPSAREDSRMDPRQKDPYSTGTRYRNESPTRGEDPRMPPRRPDPRYSPARRDPVLRGSSATDVGAGYADTPPYTSGPPLFSGSSATNLDAGLLRLGRKPQG